MIRIQSKVNVGSCERPPKQTKTGPVYKIECIMTQSQMCPDLHRNGIIL